MFFKMSAVRIRVPLLQFYDFQPNKAKFGEQDKRFFEFFISGPDKLHYYPDYAHELNPNTGDDLGVIELPLEDENIMKIVNANTYGCVYDLGGFEMDGHIGM